MKHAALTAAALFAFLFFAPRALACPFCDTGGRDAAYFIISFFGAIALGMTAVLFAFLRSGGMKKGSKYDRIPPE